MPSTRARCPKCCRCFRRLDTHLRVSATCRDVHERPEDLAAPPPKSMNTGVFTTNSNSVASSNASLCGSLNSTVTASAVATTNWQLLRMALPHHFSTSNILLGYQEPLRSGKRLTIYFLQSQHQSFRLVQQKKRTPACVLVSMTFLLLVLGQRLLPELKNQLTPSSDSITRLSKR